MNSVMPVPARRGRGRPPQHLLSALAVCGTCGRGLRIGKQKVGYRKPRVIGRVIRERPTHYSVYECSGSRGGESSFHVTMRKEHLEQIVVEAVLARILKPGFRVPRLLADQDTTGAERAALRRELKGDLAWLNAARSAAKKQEIPDIPTGQEHIVVPKMAAARGRIIALDKLDPLVRQLAYFGPNLIHVHWGHLDLAEQRHVIQALVLPRVQPVAPSNRGRRGVDTERVNLVWKWGLRAGRRHPLEA